VLALGAKKPTLGQGRGEARTTEACPERRLGVSLVHSTEKWGNAHGGKAPADHEVWESDTWSAPEPAAMTLTLFQLARRAKEEPETAFDSIVHLMDLERLRQSQAQLRRDASVGIDEVSKADYEQNLEANLQDLLRRLKDKTYRPQPVKRAYIPKEDGRQRPIGIPAYEDKIVQRAATTVMEAIYEQDFVESSYGFRPGRRAHDALEAELAGADGWKDQRGAGRRHRKLL